MDRSDKPKKCGIVGVAMQKGQQKFGPQMAPEAFRKAGFLERLKTLGMLPFDFCYPFVLIFPNL